jgi:hypothetical protein
MAAMVPFAVATTAWIVYPALTAPRAHNGFSGHCLTGSQLRSKRCFAASPSFDAHVRPGRFQPITALLGSNEQMFGVK